jgi:hypothetical protein
MLIVAVRFVRLAALLPLLLLGCDRLPTSPGSRELQLMLSISSGSGDPTHPIQLRAHARNGTRHTVTYSEGYGFRLMVRDPERRAIESPCLECPGILCNYPAIPDRIISLAPGASVIREYTFQGGLSDCDGQFLGPSGTYTAEARFEVWSEAENQRAAISKTATFVWSAQAPD